VDKLKIDSHKIQYHPERLAQWLQGETIYPIYIEIGLTDICNHRCIFCALDYVEKQGNFLNTSTLIKTFADMGEKGVKAVMFSGEGEPLLHKDFPLLVRAAGENGIDTSVTTNGVRFTPEMAEYCLPYLSWIKFSIDAGTPETYSKIHGTKAEDFHTLLNNLEQAVAIRKKSNLKAKIGTQILLLQENASEVETLSQLVQQAGADYLVVKPYSQHPSSHNKLAVSYESLHHLESSLDRIRAKTKGFDIIYRSKTMGKLNDAIPYPVCYGLPFFALIDAKANIIPCNIYYGKEEYYYGNLYEKSFPEIWTGARRQAILEKISQKGTRHCRMNCRLDSINRYLDDLKNPPEHVNFI